MDSVLEFRPTIEQKPRRFPPVAVLSFVLLMAALLIVAWGIADVSHGLELLLLAVMAIGGAVVGWLLALNPIGAGLAIVLSLFAGLAAMLLLVGRIGNEFVAMTSSLIEMSGPLWRSVAA